MSLKIDLRSGEKVYVGNSILTVASDERSTIIIDGTLPVIRENDFVPAEQATTPLLALTHAVQMHYLAPEQYSLSSIFQIYLSASWSNSDAVAGAMKLVSQGELYRAIRALKDVLKIERK
jgi:flagellar biosynthesis regulator FlbT